MAGGTGARDGVSSGPVDPVALPPIVVQGPPWYVPIVAALLGALVGGLISWGSVRWSLKRADDLARNRERQRDDRQHARTILFDRYERQRATLAEFRRAMHLSKPSGGPLTRPLADTVDVEGLRSLIDFAYEQPPAFSKACLDSLNGYRATGQTGQDEALARVNANIAAMHTLLQATVKALEVPAVEDAEPFRQKFLAADAAELRRLTEPLARLVTRPDKDDQSKPD